MQKKSLSWKDWIVIGIAIRNHYPQMDPRFDYTFKIVPDYHDEVSNVIEDPALISHTAESYSPILYKLEHVRMKPLVCEQVCQGESLFILKIGYSAATKTIFLGVDENFLSLPFITTGVES